MSRSLEIVNKLLEKINQYDDWFLTEVEAEQIQQDLEVLEIFKKAFGDCEFTFFSNGSAEIEFSGSDLCIEAIDGHTDLKVKEVKKLKQWLEENEE